MNVTIIINSKLHCAHKEKKTILEKVLADDTVSTIDMHSNKPLHIIYDDIVKTHPELIITLDAAGFELETELQTPSLFKIHARGIHFLFDRMYKYGKVVDENFYLGHIVCVSEGEDLVKLAAQYPNIPDIKTYPSFEGEQLATFFDETLRELELK